MFRFQGTWTLGFHWHAFGHLYQFSHPKSATHERDLRIPSPRRCCSRNCCPSRPLRAKMGRMRRKCFAREGGREGGREEGGDLILVVLCRGGVGLFFGPLAFVTSQLGAQRVLLLFGKEVSVDRDSVRCRERFVLATARFTTKTCVREQERLSII